MTLGITTKQLADFKNWFNTYTTSFLTGTQKVKQNIELKICHTLQVCKVIRTLAESLGLSVEAVNLAEAAALFHDIGRFEQYRQYQTFSDSKSVNHGELGATILLKENILTQLDALEREILKKSVRYHNRKIMPVDDNKDVLLFCKMIRDADKIDIFRVVTDYYEDVKNKKRNETVELDLPDLPDLTETVLNDLRKRQPVDMRYLKTLNDFKMVQIGWVYDLNFGYSMQYMIDKSYLDRIRVELPELSVVDEIVNDAKKFIQEKCHQAIIHHTENLMV